MHPHALTEYLPAVIDHNSHNFSIFVFFAFFAVSEEIELLRLG